MRPRPADLLIPLLTVVALATLAAFVVVGVRAARTSSDVVSTEPLQRPPFRSPPRLGLGLLDPPAQGRVALPSVRPVEVADLRGRPVILTFWASWCVPCRRETALLERTWRAEAGRVLVLGVNQGDREDAAHAFLRRHGVTYPSVRGGGYAVAQRWRIPGLPVTFFLSRRGHIVAQRIGLLRPEQLRRGIAAARADRAVPRS